MFVADFYQSLPSEVLSLNLNKEWRVSYGFLMFLMVSCAWLAWCPGDGQRCRSSSFHKHQAGIWWGPSRNGWPWQDFIHEDVPTSVSKWQRMANHSGIWLKVATRAKHFISMAPYGTTSPEPQRSNAAWQLTTGSSGFVAAWATARWRDLRPSMLWQCNLYQCVLQ